MNRLHIVGNCIGYSSCPTSVIENNIANVMDAVIFNRNMKRPRLDRNFFLKMNPENKWIKPETTEEQK